MDLQAFLFATLTAHVGFTVFVLAHARFTGEEAGKWPLLTLAFGIAGVAAYFFYDEGDGTILD